MRPVPVYPGAESSAPWFQDYAADTKASLRKLSHHSKLRMWMTMDPFDQVVTFYRQLGREQAEFARSFLGNLRAKSGYDVQATHIIFDDATSPVASKDYASIQRPVIVSFEPLVVHDVTQIAWYTRLGE